MNAYLFNERLTDLFEQRIRRFKECCAARENIEPLIVDFKVLSRIILVSVK